MNEKVLLKPREVEELTGISADKVRTLCKNPALNFPYIKNGRNYLILKDELMEWITKNKGIVV